MNATSRSEQMRTPAPATKPIHLASPGHVAFALTFIGLGIMGFIKGGFTPIWTGVPKDLPARPALAYLTATVSLGCGLGLLWRRAADFASRVLLTYLILWVIAFRVPLIFRAPATTVAWWSIGETSVMLAGAWVLYTWFGQDADGKRDFVAGEPGLRIARVLYGLALIPFGIAHFTYFERTVSMVPGWLPGHPAWATFTGCSLIVAGVAIVAGVFPRLAAMLSALEMGLFTLLVWGPVVAAGPGVSDWGEIVSSCALSAGGWVVADSYRGMAWLAGRTRKSGSTSAP